MKHRIVFTGGGSAGHVTPNLALIPVFHANGFEIHYFGRRNSIESNLVGQLGIATFHEIPAGKLRRYFSLENITDPFKIFLAFITSFLKLIRIKPSVLFSKGGFVSAPVVWAAGILKTPVVIHESDYSPGLANRLAFPFANRICCTFEETVDMLPPGKAVWTGLPIRKELIHGDARKGREFLGFDEKPVILIIGGSLGSERVNESVISSLSKLSGKFNICHICGEGKIRPHLEGTSGYCQFEYLDSQLADVLAASDIVISRAGATTIFELLALHKPSLLIPLSHDASRGDQIQNADSFKSKGWAMVLKEEDLEPESLISSIERLFSEKDSYIRRMEQANMPDATDKIITLIEREIKV